nr:GSTd protein [Diaphanosoma celebensis]
MPIDFYTCSASAPCRSVAMTARVVGIELKVNYVDLMAGEQMKPEFLKINPQHNVPTIGDDGFYLNESRAICTYLIEKYAKDDSLYPKDAQKRALVNQRLYFDMGTFYDRFGKVYYPVMFGGATKLDEKAQSSLKEAIGWLNSFLENSKYVAGDQLTVADISLVSSASTMEAGVDNIFDEYPNVKSWLERCKQEIEGYDETNAPGATGFGQWLRGALAKLE